MLKIRDEIMYKFVVEKDKDSTIDEVRKCLTPGDFDGELKLFSMSGPGIDMELVNGCPCWVVNAHSAREANFKIFALGTEFFDDLMAYADREREAMLKRNETMMDLVLNFEDSSAWSLCEVNGNCII